MKILGIDFGKKNIGLAIAEDFLPEPHSKLKIKNAFGPSSCRGEKLKIERIKRICETERIDKIVIGISEGRMARETRKFGERLKRATGLSVDYQDETLTSEEAKRLMVKIGKPKKKRQEQTDAIAAALILQDYLERKKSIV
ncbi:Holliday junction resolvase RuvX [Candidatus Microgenomates bacterium]|nr:Holliday junction resolvase RuvX [Candidatus Microgenomates bacterium]